MQCTARRLSPFGIGQEVACHQIDTGQGLCLSPSLDLRFLFIVRSQPWGMQPQGLDQRASSHHRLAIPGRAQEYQCALESFLNSRSCSPILFFYLPVSDSSNQVRRPLSLSIIAKMDDKNLEMNDLTVVEISGNHGGGYNVDSKRNTDDQEMAYYGKAQQLKVSGLEFRGLGLLSCFAKERMGDCHLKFC